MWVLVLSLEWCREGRFTLPIQDTNNFWGDVPVVDIKDTETLSILPLVLALEMCFEYRFFFLKKFPLGLACASTIGAPGEGLETYEPVLGA